MNLFEYITENSPPRAWLDLSDEAKRLVTVLEEASVEPGIWMASIHDWNSMTEGLDWSDMLDAALDLGRWTKLATVVIGDSDTLRVLISVPEYFDRLNKVASRLVGKVQEIAA